MKFFKIFVKKLFFLLLLAIFPILPGQFKTAIDIEGVFCLKNLKFSFDFQPDACDSVDWRDTFSASDVIGTLNIENPNARTLYSLLVQIRDGFVAATPKLISYFSHFRDCLKTDIDYMCFCSYLNEAIRALAVREDAGALYLLAVNPALIRGEPGIQFGNQFFKLMSGISKSRGDTRLEQFFHLKLLSSLDKSSTLFNDELQEFVASMRSKGLVDDFIDPTHFLLKGESAFDDCYAEYYDIRDSGLCSIQ